MEEDQQFCLRWNNHQSTLISVFDTLFDNGKLVDCTLAAEGQFVKAHKVVLSACSPYFATLLTEQYDKHPIFILKDVKYQELRAMMDYMYRGEVNISQDQLAALLKAAESLQIKGLSDNRSGGDNSQKTSSAEHKHVSVPGKANVGYTLEQTKRARLGPSSAELHDVAGSREGSSSPTGTRKRRKIRRRSVDNVMADNHENSNSSQSIQINSSVPSSNVTGTISTSIATGPAVGGASSLPQGAGNLIASNVTKKTENVSKMGSNNDAITAADNEQNDEHDKQIGTVKKDQNHKRSSKVINLNEKETDIVIEPKSEYDDDGNDETVEDLTLDDEDMGLEDLDQAAGPSHGGEGSSQGYAQWQVDRSQDEVFMAAQEAQQRDPQDLSTKVVKSTTTKDNGIPVIKQAIKKPNILKPGHGKNNGKRISDVSDMLFEFYKLNQTANAPKNEKTEKHIRQSSPSSADGAVPAHSSTPNGTGGGNISAAPLCNSKIPNEPTKTATNNTNTASKNLNGDEMAPKDITNKKNTTPFHPRIKYTSVNKEDNIKAITTDDVDIKPFPLVAGIPSSVIHPPIISPAAPAAAAFAAALFRDGYHNLHQQLRAQELLKQQIAPIVAQNNSMPPTNQLSPTKAQFLQNFLRKDHRTSENDDGCSDSDITDEEMLEDDDGKYPGFDDIHLIEGSKSGYNHHQMNLSAGADYMSDESQKYMMQQSMKNLEYSLSDYGGGSPGEETAYQCRHCGKKYRWKSTLRRHENVECGGKEPAHQCPYCPYKSKQRGNLGVHVRKHHSNLPQLASKRRSKYSQPMNFTNEKDITI